MKTDRRNSLFRKMLIFIISIASLSGTVCAASQLSQFGITWKFDHDYQVGQFCNGDWWVVGPVTIIEITPSSTSSGRAMNGSMLNPSPSSDKLGYDSVMTGYDAALNVALNVSPSNPLILQPDSSLVSTISKAAEGARPQLETAAILTVLDAPAPAGSFRPAYCGNDKTIRFNKSRLDYSFLHSLQKVPQTPRLKQFSGDGQKDSVERMFERPWIDHRRGWYGRFIHPSDNMPDYGREMSTQIGEAALMLHLDYTEAEKETLLIRFVQLGIDLYGIVENGGYRTWEPDGGHASARKWAILFAGMVLGDPAMAGIGSQPINNPHFGEDGQTFYVTQEDINRNNYTQEHLGMPEWGIRHSTYPDKDSVSWGASYRQCCTANAWGGFVLACHIMGMKSQWQHDALFDYQDRYMSIETPGTFNRQQSRFAEQMWDTYRADYGPIWPNTSSNQSPQANAGPDQTVVDNDGNGTAQVTLNGSGSNDPDGYITSYVWKENGSQIATGVNPTVTLSQGQHTITLEVTDNKGAKGFDTVVITVEGVDVDTEAPTVVSVSGLNNIVTVVFSEALDQASAETVANYSINHNVTISEATLESDQKKVTLHVSSLTEDTIYTLTVRGIKDLAGNAMQETPENFNYTGGRVSYWKFDEGSGTTAQDALDPANTGALINGPVWTNGYVNGGLLFNGYDDAVEVTTSNFNPDAGTISLWAYPQGFLNPTQYLFGLSMQPWSNRIQLYCEDTGMLSLGLGDNHFLNRNICSMTPDQWHHVVLVWNNPSYTVYVNGIHQAAGTYTGLNQIAAYADIGNNGDASNRIEAFDGVLDEVRIYSRALSSDEVLSIFNANPELLFDPIGDKVVDENATLSFAVQTTAPDVTVNMVENNLPGQPEFVNNVFTWTSTYNCSGIYECTFTAASDTFVDSETITVTVNNINRSPLLASIGDKQIDEGSALSFTVTATDPDGDDLTYTAANLPAGASFSGQTFSWTPQSGQAGSYDVTFITSDGHLQDSETVTITVQPSVSSSPYDQLVSYSIYRTSSEPLAGNSVSGNIYVFISPDTGIEQVLFYLDDPDMSGTPYQIEGREPYDFAGTASNNSAYPFDTTQLSDGQHTITAKVTQTDGSIYVINSGFTVANNPITVNNPPVLDFIPDQSTEETVALTFTVNATDPDGDVLTYAASNLPAGATFSNRTFSWTPAVGQAGDYQVAIGVTDGEWVDTQLVTITVVPQAQKSSYELLVSYSKYRTNPEPLSGNTVSGNIYVFLMPETDVKQVRFYLDDPDMSGSFSQVENSAPFDFAGGKISWANAFDTTGLSDGKHTITAQITSNSEGTQIVSSDFIVDN